ncbi:glycosyltransferase [Methylobacterium sp. Leaf108]|uniref:glycosyltransferase n=1 Tax=Methylobacterium sp. Leaf108 TaxID=1736256 RepID=UPI000B01B28F|nr:glycosyltransferase [Methylobacterium sp. Leaf108]
MAVPSLDTPSASPAGQEPRRRILHVFRAPVGGLFRHVSDLVRLQAAAGHDVGIVCDAGTGGDRAERALADLRPVLRLGVVRIPMSRNPHAADLAALWRLSRHAAALGVGVLHGHGAKGGAYARLAVVRGAIRAYTPHGGSYNYRPGSRLHRLYMGVERALAGRTDVFLFESAFVAGRHRAYVGETRRARIVYNGIDAAEFAPIARAHDPFDLVYVGELREAKGIPVLIDALAALRAAGRPVRLLMVGSGPDADAIAAAVARLGLADAVVYEPPQPIRDALARGRVMVVPSFAESLPYVVLEAAAARQPLVATDVGGIPEIFGAAARDLVPPRDAKALAAALARVLDEAPEALAERVGRLATSVEARFSMRRMGAGVLAGYAAAVAARGDPARSAAIFADDPLGSGAAPLSLP